jgi:phage tail-like protein
VSVARPESAAALPPSLNDANLRPRRDPDWMLKQLPVQLTSADFFSRFVSIFQELGTRLLEDADNVDFVADVSLAPTDNLAWLGSWIGVDGIDPAMPDELRRRIVSTAATTLTWRGTVHGLQSYLELLSGEPVLVEDGGGVWRAGDAPADTAWVRMRVRTTGLLERAAFVDVVRDEVPAHVRAELWIGDQLAWSSDDEDPLSVLSELPDQTQPTAVPR